MRRNGNVIHLPSGTLDAEFARMDRLERERELRRQAAAELRRRERRPLHRALRFARGVCLLPFALGRLAWELWRN